MPTTSVHERIVHDLRALIEGRAVVVDASTRGTEEVLLLLELSVDDGPGPPPEVPAAGPELDVSGAVLLHLLLVAPTPLVWLEPTARRRPLPATGLGDWLRLALEAAHVLRVGAGASGRIVRIDAVSGAEGRHRSLVLDPLPNACRLLVLDEAGRVEQRFPPPVHATAPGRGTPGRTYQEPPGDFSERWLRWEHSARNGEPPTSTRTDTTPLPNGEQTDGLWVCARDLPEAPAARDAGLFLSPVACETSTAIAGPLAPLEAARRIGRLWIAHTREFEARRRTRQRLTGELKHLRRLLGRLDTEVDEAESGPRLRRQAEALLAAKGRVPKGAAEVEVPDLADPARTLRVRLDPARGFADNVNQLFRRASKLERALALRATKQEQLRELIEQTGAWRADVDARPLGWRDSLEGELRHRRWPPWLPEVDPAQRPRWARLEPGLRRRWERLLEGLSDAAAALERPVDHAGYGSRKAASPDRDRSGSAPGSAEVRTGTAAGIAADRGPTEAAAERAGIHPRRYALADGWIVLVGRSNKENDLLTHKAARPRDIWFHARGVAGSHVVLQRGDRKDNPSKVVLDQAASIAAYYSKARTSRHAPVIYTEKRYVRKPRKAPPGLAVCIREKVLMAEPRLPATAAEEN